MSKSNSIIKQASILALAGILVRIIGLLYRSPLTKIITLEGIGYYSIAYNIYALILLISSYSIPTAISKLLSEKLVLKEYGNAKKILQCAFIYILVIGGSAALITFIIAPFIIPEKSVLALRVLCPTILLSGFLGVFRGYFQAYQTTLYTSISQIIEQLFNAIVSVGAAYLFIQPYLNVGGSKMASVGAAGSALGTGAGVLVGLIYMILMYLKKHQKMSDEISHNEPSQSYREVFKAISSIVMPIIIATCVYNLVSTIDTYIYCFLVGNDAHKITTFGIYTGEYLVLQNVPVALASAMSTASIPAISAAWSLKDRVKVKNHISSGIMVTMMVLIPSAFGMAALAFPIIGILFPQEGTVLTAATLLMLGSPAIVFYGLSTFTNGVLQALGKPKIPLRNAIIALVFHCILMIALLLLTDLGLYAFVIGNCLYGLQLCIANQKALHRIIGYKPKIKRTYLLPLLASLIMAITVIGSYYGLFTLTKMVFIPLIIAIILGIIVYFVIVIYLYKDHPQMLAQIPYISKIISRLNR